MNGPCSLIFYKWLLSLPLSLLQMRKRKQRKLIMNWTLSGMRWLHRFFNFVLIDKLSLLVLSLGKRLSLPFGRRISTFHPHPLHFPLCSPREQGSSRTVAHQRPSSVQQWHGEGSLDWQESWVLTRHRHELAMWAWSTYTAYLGHMCRARMGLDHLQSLRRKAS